MRIGTLLGSFPVLSESFIRNEIHALRKTGLPVDIVAMVKEESTQLSKQEQELVKTATYLQDLPPPSWSKVLKFLPNILSIIPFLWAQKELSPASLLYHGIRIALKGYELGWTHIHTHFAWGHASYAIVAAKLLNIPVTLTCHGSDVYATPQDLQAKLDHSDSIIAVCDEMRETLAAQTHTPIQIIACGVDTDEFTPLKTKKSNGRLLFVGRLIDCKGVDDLLHAMTALPTKHRLPLDIIGDGPLRAELEQLSKELELDESVSFLGAKPANWLKKNGPHYHAFVSAFREGEDGAKDTGPIVIKEAMAMGLPIISTEFMGIPEMVDPTCGTLIPPKNREALQQALFQLWEKPESKRLRMGENGRKKLIDNFSINKQIHDLRSLWSDLA